MDKPVVAGSNAGSSGSKHAIPEADAKAADRANSRTGGEDSMSAPSDAGRGGSSRTKPGASMVDPKHMELRSGEEASEVVPSSASKLKPVQARPGNDDIGPSLPVCRANSKGPIETQSGTDIKDSNRADPIAGSMSSKQAWLCIGIGNPRTVRSRANRAGPRQARDLTRIANSKSARSKTIKEAPARDTPVTDNARPERASERGEVDSSR